MAAMIFSISATRSRWPVSYCAMARSQRNVRANLGSPVSLKMSLSSWRGECFKGSFLWGRKAGKAGTGKEAAQQLHVAGSTVRELFVDEGAGHQVAVF